MYSDDYIRLELLSQAISFDQASLMLELRIITLIPRVCPQMAPREI